MTSLFRGLANLGISAKHVYTTHIQLLSHQGAWSFRQMPTGSGKVWAHLSSASQHEQKCRYGERRTSLWRGKKSDKLDQTSEKAVHFQIRKWHHLLGFFTFSVCCFLLLQDPQSLSVGQKRGGSLLRLHSLVHIQSVYWLCQASKAVCPTVLFHLSILLLSKHYCSMS